jgi:hypothetical protein
LGETNKYRYLLYGWVAESDIQFPELPETNGNPEIFIKLSETMDSVGDKDSFAFTIEKIGNFKITTDRIIVNPFCEELIIRPYILGTAFGALIHKRNMIVIHGSAVQHNGKAFILSGSSGSGKSTLAAAFIRKGLKILSDDVCIISLKESYPMVHPSYPQLKLWLDASDGMNVNWSGKYKISTDKDKYSYSIQNYFYPHMQPFRYLYILNRNKSDIAIQELYGVEKFNMLASQTYRLGFVQKLRREKDHFGQITTLADKIKVFNLFYPDNFDKIEEVTEKIYFHLNEYEGK